MLVQILLMVIACITAIIALVLARLGLVDKRKLIWGLRARQIKNGCFYLSFIATLSTIILQARKDIDAKFESLKRNQQVDRVERAHFDSTLAAIDSTLRLQIRTIRSTDSIIKQQNATLKNQQLSFDANTRILTNQKDQVAKLTRVLTEADRIGGTSIDWFWMPAIDTVKKGIAQMCRENIKPSVKLESPRSGYYSVVDTMMEGYPPLIYSVNIVFYRRNIESGIQKLIAKNINVFEETGSMVDLDMHYKLGFLHDAVQIKAVGMAKDNTDEFTYKANGDDVSVQCRYRNTSCVAANNNLPSFSDLKDMNAFVVINCFYSSILKMSTNGMKLTNNRGNINMYLDFKKVVAQRDYRVYNRSIGMLYQKIILARPSTFRRMDRTPDEDGFLY